MEFSGAESGPVNLTGMMLADLGAEIVRIDRPTKQGGTRDPKSDILGRGHRSLALDLKNPLAVQAVLRLAKEADILIEGFRPGVMERMGLGPDACHAVNPKLVYGRMTGWGQTGPLAKSAGHDINYVALSGALWSCGRADEIPAPPVNYVGDMGGGGILLAFGLMCAVYEARNSGKGQVVDAAMVDGAALQMSAIFMMQARGDWIAERGVNMLDTGAHFYEVYETRDGGYMALGAIEPQFYAALCKGANLDPAIFGNQMDRQSWPKLKEVLRRIFKTKTRAEWTAIFEGTDACVTPVLAMKEAPGHAHNAARKTFLEIDGVVQPAPLPRFSRTAGAISRPPPRPGQDSRDVLSEWGLSDADIAALVQANAIF